MYAKVPIILESNLLYFSLASLVALYMYSCPFPQILERPRTVRFGLSAHPRRPHQSSQFPSDQNILSRHPGQPSPRAVQPSSVRT
jgi:hypothetical protein